MKKWLIPLIAAVTLIFAALACSPAKKSVSARTIVEAADGLPHTLDELNAWYVEPAAEQNAAVIYAQGFKALQLEASSNLPLLGKAKLPPLGAPMPAAMKSSLAAFVNANHDALQFFAEGARLEQLRSRMAPRLS